MVTEPGPLLASGRDGDIFEFGPGLVLRRAKSGRVIEGEARVIAYVREYGYPAPEIHEVRAGGTEIVMERIDGPMMMDVMMHKPWLMPRYSRELADLHDRLHVIPAPEWLPDAGGDRLVHLDLHPMNVMITASGPIVIDWNNAARGEPLLDVAMTYVLLTCPRTGLGPAQRRAPTRPAPPRQHVREALPRPRARPSARSGSGLEDARQKHVTRGGRGYPTPRGASAGPQLPLIGTPRRAPSGGHRDDGSPRSRHPVHHLPCLVARRFRQLAPARCSPASAGLTVDVARKAVNRSPF